jgi:hypothetical protein
MGEYDWEWMLTVAPTSPVDSQAQPEWKLHRSKLGAYSQKELGNHQPSSKPLTTSTTPPINLGYGLAQDRTRSVLQASPNANQAMMIKAFASLRHHTQGRSLRQVCHPPISGKENPRQPKRQTNLIPKQIKRAYNGLIVQRGCGTPPQTVKHSAASNSNNQPKKSSQDRSRGE